jgi:hypothetical protein
MQRLGSSSHGRSRLDCVGQADVTNGGGGIAIHRKLCCPISAISENYTPSPASTPPLDFASRQRQQSGGEGGEGGESRSGGGGLGRTPAQLGADNLPLWLRAESGGSGGSGSSGTHNSLSAQVHASLASESEKPKPLWGEGGSRSGGGNSLSAVHTSLASDSDKRRPLWLQQQRDEDSLGSAGSGGAYVYIPSAPAGRSAHASRDDSWGSAGAGGTAAASSEPHELTHRVIEPYAPTRLTSQQQGRRGATSLLSNLSNLSTNLSEPTDARHPTGGMRLPTGGPGRGGCKEGLLC